MANNGLRNHLADIAAKRGNLLDQTRTQVAVLERGHEEDRVDFGGQLPVRVGHLQLRLEVGYGAQATHDERCFGGAAEVDSQTIECLDVNPGRYRHRTAFGDGLAYDRDPLLRRQRRRGLLRIHKDAEDYPVEDGRRARHHIEVAVGDRVERARVDGNLHWAASSD